MTTMDVEDAMFHYTSAPHRSMDEYTAFVFDSFRDCRFASTMRWVCWSTRVGSGTRRRARLDAPRTGTTERVTGHTVVTTVDRPGLDLELGSSRAALCAGVASLSPGCVNGDVVTVCTTACPTTIPDHAANADLLRSAIDETCSAFHGTSTTAVRR
ncbi:hypothetical protein QM588_22935 [Rhodococcus sp. IEGM 1354]|uniref:hypothetical protein n=1 Tax=Rhodococcus sp. IEGM 1354 TaxID=3047088 RepID=UPI0024B741F1|nr:hypothetical protein [Rhodococcus sp. IEGM 1354]MDI9933281.1 hypothetical protein [Rhodococcus sp. IEGM 1354]